MRVTVDDIMELRPICYGREEVKEMFRGAESATPMEIARAKHVRVADRLWVLLRPESIPEHDLRLLECDFAECLLPIWEAQHPGDMQPRDAIATKRRWLMGDATDEELAAATTAATAAAWEGWAPARAAERAEERARQLARVVDVLEEIEALSDPI